MKPKTLAGSGSTRTSFQAEVAAGKTVLVDVTADWCLTCQVNKSLVLNRGQVSSLLENGAVIGMRADWTRPNPEISRYLRLFDRFGIPFNVVYGPDSPHGHPLPEILTEAAVLDGIRTAGGRASQSLRLNSGQAWGSQPGG